MARITKAYIKRLKELFKKTPSEELQKKIQRAEVRWQSQLPERQR